MKKIIFLLFCIILLISGIAAIFIYYQKTNAWKTYTDPTFGYSLQYPPSWQVEKIGKKGEIRIFNPDKNIKILEGIEIDPYNYHNVRVPIKEWIEKEAKRSAVESRTKGPSAGGSPLSFIRETTIDNFPAVKASWNNALGTQIIYLIPYKQTIYSLTLVKEKSETDDFDENGNELAIIFRNMLSSFKFAK